MKGNKKKTVCIVMGGHFAATIGGAQFQAKCIVEGLKNTGNFNIIYLAGLVDPDYVPEGYKIVKLNGPPALRKYGFVFDTLYLLKQLKEISPDVVYQRGFKAHTGVIAYYAKKYGCHSIFHIAHDYDLLPLDMWGKTRRNWLRRLEKGVGEYGLRNANSIIAQTQHQADLLLRNYGRQATTVMPNIHPLPNEPLTKSADEIRIIWVANFKAVKRPELFVQLAEDLASREELRFVMIGRSGEGEKYADLHNKISQIPNLTYMGEQPIEEVNKQLAAGDIFINTSRAEGFPNTFIQAWMRRVPTISLDVNPDEVLTTKSIGFWSRTYENMRDQVLELADNHKLRESMGEAAQHHAFDMHSPKSVEKLIEIIEGFGNE